MGNVSLTTMVQRIRTRLEDAPSLGITLVPGQTGVSPAGQQHQGVAVLWRGTSTERVTRHQTTQRVTDSVTIQLTYRVRPGDKDTDFDAASDLSAAIRNRLTLRSDTTLGQLNPEAAGESLIVTSEEWIRIDIDMLFHRYREVGGG